MSVWIEADDQHKRMLDASKLETIYLRYKGYSSWAVVGTFADRDILIKTLATESDAVCFLDALVKKLS